MARRRQRQWRLGNPAHRVREAMVDNRRVFDTGDNLERPTTVAGLDVDPEHAFQPLSSAHGGTLLQGGFVSVVAGAQAAVGRKNTMRGPIAVRGLKLVTHLTLAGQRQTLVGNRRPSDVVTQPLELVAVMGGRGDTACSENLDALAVFPAWGKGAQRKGFFPLMRPDRNPIGDGTPDQVAQGGCRRAIPE